MDACSFWFQSGFRPGPAPKHRSHPLARYLFRRAIPRLQNQSFRQSQCDSQACATVLDTTLPNALLPMQFMFKIASRLVLKHAGNNIYPACHTYGRGIIMVVKNDSVARKPINIRRFHILVTLATKTIRALVKRRAKTRLGRSAPAPVTNNGDKTN